MGIRYCGYLAAWSVAGMYQGRVVAHLSEGACQQLLSLRRQKGTLRGQHVELARRKKDANAAVDLNPAKWYVSGNLPDEFDVVPHLLKLFNVPEIRQEPGYVYPRPWLGPVSDGWTPFAGYGEAEQIPH
jgi:hypothetical protein